MKKIKIHADLCTGCGRCASACAEGAIQMIEGKAVLVNESHCDGLGACIPGCEFGALELVEVEVEIKNEKQPEHVFKNPTAHKGHAHACPSTRFGGNTTQWPIQLRLVNSAAPFLKNQEIILAADCSAFVCKTFHERFRSANQPIIIACPKLDHPMDSNIEKLVDLFSTSQPQSVTVVRMEVPCCSGLSKMAQIAVIQMQAKFKLIEVTVSVRGEVLGEMVLN